MFTARNLCCVLFFGLFTQSVAEPIGWLTKRSLFNDTIQHFVIMSESFAITTAFPLITHNQKDLCAHTYSEGRQYCIEVLKIVYPRRTWDFAILEIAGNFLFNSYTSSATIYLGGRRPKLPDFRYVIRLPKNPVDIEKWDKMYVKTYETTHYFEKVMQIGGNNDSVNDTFLQFTRFVDDREAISLCPWINGLPLYGKYAVIGLLTYSSENCIDIYNCAQSCEQINRRNYQQKTVTFLNLLNVEIQDLIHKYVPGFEYWKV